MAADEMQKVIASFRDPDAPKFMGRRQSSQTQRIHEMVANSKAAAALVADGYTLEFAYRVAQMEREYQERAPLALLAGTENVPTAFEPGGSADSLEQDAEVNAVYERALRRDMAAARTDVFKPDVVLDASQVEDRRAWPTPWSARRGPQPSPPPPGRSLR